MRVALSITVLAFGVAMAPPLALAGRAQSNPTPAEIQKAIRSVERSDALWATINVCNSRRYPQYIGVRGQMPALGFPSWMTMFVSIRSYSKTKRRFVPDAKATMRVRLGRNSTGLQQDGATFQFPPHTGLFDATIEFVWRRSGKVLADVTRRTTAGHRDADFGSTPRYSAENCRIP
jgi:hypothetical protein